jgi:NADH:ubiquinone oxidoreductase subunit E
MLEGLQSLIDRYRGREAAVIALLQDISRQYGYLPEEALQEVSAQLGIPLSRLYSLATFYSSFRLKPMGKHRICVCVGTACHVKGAAKIVDAMERDLGITPGRTTEDGLFTLETVNCLGACALAPLVVLDEEYHGKMDARKASRLVAQSQEDDGAAEAPAASA